MAMLSDYVPMPIRMLLAGVVLTLVGLNHVFDPSGALVAQLIEMLGVSGGALVDAISFGAGLVVTALGIDQLTMLLDEAY
jgi:hypothetical protein